MVFVLDSNLLALTLLVTIGMQLTFFAIAWTFKFDKVTDIAGSMNFVLIAWLTFLVHGTFYARQIVVVIMVTVWGGRLGLFLLYRVLVRGKDERFDEIRESFGKFLGFWIYQMLWAWIVSLPVTFLMAGKNDVSIGALDGIGWACWGIGFIFEALADQSKHNHYADERTRKTFLRTNVWAVSRHPNYFGEIMCWLGIFLTSASVYERNTRAGYVSVLSPLFTAFLLLFVSGIPLGEERYDRKFGHLAEYIEYKRTTSPLIPMPPALYACMPEITRLVCCCEFPAYNKVPLAVGVKHQTDGEKQTKREEKDSDVGQEQDALRAQRQEQGEYQASA